MPHSTGSADLPLHGGRVPTWRHVKSKRGRGPPGQKSRKKTAKQIELF